MATKHLTRSRDDRIIAGVAGGLARYLDVDPMIVRLVFVLLAITFGAGILAYIAAIIIIPEDKEERMDDQEATPGTPETSQAPGTSANPDTATDSTPETAAEPAPGVVAESSAADPLLPPPAAAPPFEPPPGTTPPPEPPPTTTPPTVPPSPPTPPEAPHEENRRRRMAFGLVLIFLGILFLFQQFVPEFDWGRFWPVLLIGLGAYLLLRERDQ